MTPSLLIITGWAHSEQSVQPLADALSSTCDVQIWTGARVLRERTVPETDFIVTGSMGGLLAMELLPASCRKLVLLSSTAKFCAGEEYRCGTPEKVVRRMMVQMKKNPEAVLAEFYRNVHHPHPAVDTDPGCPPEELIAGLDYLRTSDVRANVPNIGIPALLLHGTADRIIPPAAAEWLHAQLPDSRLKLYPNGSHALPAHRFTEVINEITIFLELH